MNPEHIEENSSLYSIWVIWVSVFKFLSVQRSTNSSAIYVWNAQIKSCYDYLAENLIFSIIEEEHKTLLQIGLDRLNSYGLTINVSKSISDASEVPALGYFI